MEQNQATEPLPAIKKKQEDKYRKKDSKSWENISKAMSAMDESEKLVYLEKKYNEVYDINRQLTVTNQQLSKQLTIVQKERDHNQAELAKSVVGRARLEGLCRELQKQNKQIKDENIAKIKEEEERRKEVSQKFADKLSDINNMMDENKEKSDKLREDNVRMTTKLAELYSQFQQREESINVMTKQLELEREYFQANFTKMELEMRAQQEMHAKERDIMKSNLAKSEANCAVLMDTVKELQEHVEVYKTQYTDFETTMTKSTKAFDNFKAEISAINKQMAAVEQEAQGWKNKFHDSMKAVVELSEVRRQQDLHVQSLDKKVDQLNKLCRQLVVDRGHFLKLLKENGIEPGTAPFAEEAAGPKLTKKEKELQLLKSNLKSVQDELDKMNPEDLKSVEDLANLKLKPKLTRNRQGPMPSPEPVAATEEVCNLPEPALSQQGTSEAQDSKNVILNLTDVQTAQDSKEVQDLAAPEPVIQEPEQLQNGQQAEAATH